MLIDHIGNPPPAGLPAAIRSALDWLARQDFSTTPPGRITLDGDHLFALVQETDTSHWDLGRPEVHQRYADIQFLLEGEEMIGYLPRGIDAGAPVDTRPERDIAFHAPHPAESRLLLVPGMYALFLPGELHRPCRSVGKDGPIRKIVIKLDSALLA